MFTKGVLLHIRAADPRPQVFEYVLQVAWKLADCFDRVESFTNPSQLWNKMHRGVELWPFFLSSEVIYYFCGLLRNLRNIADSN